MTYQEFKIHANNIDEFYKNNNLEWEDEEPDNTNQAITLDYLVWAKHNRNSALDFYYENRYEFPDDLDNNLLEYYRKVRSNIDGFLLCPCGKFNGQLVMSKRRVLNNIEEVADYLNREKQHQNCQILLYTLYEKPKRLETTSKTIVNTNDKSKITGTVTYPQDLDTKIWIRYAIVPVNEVAHSS
jgi:hypothetical protein